MPPFAVFFAGLLLGAAAGAVGSRMLPMLSSGARPTLKSAVKTAAKAAHSARVAAHELGETVEDLYAEAKSELETEHGGAAAEAYEEPAPAAKPRKKRARKPAAAKRKTA